LAWERVLGCRSDAEQCGVVDDGLEVVRRGCSRGSQKSELEGVQGARCQQAEDITAPGCAQRIVVYDARLWRADGGEWERRRTAVEEDGICDGMMMGRRSSERRESYGCGCGWWMPLGPNSRSQSLANLYFDLCLRWSVLRAREKV